MTNTPNEFTYSGEPPQSRNVGDVVGKWNETYRPEQPNKQSLFTRLWNAFWDALAINF